MLQAENANHSKSSSISSSSASPATSLRVLLVEAWAARRPPTLCAGVALDEGACVTDEVVGATRLLAGGPLAAAALAGRFALVFEEEACESAPALLPLAGAAFAGASGA